MYHSIVAADDLVSDGAMVSAITGISILMNMFIINLTGIKTWAYFLYLAELGFNQWEKTLLHL